MSDKFINLRKVFEDKNPALLKVLPKFILNYLKRIVHEDEINDFINKNQDVMGVDFCKAVVRDFDITVNVFGLENIPRTGGVLLAGNHPLGGLDALSIVDKLTEHRTDIRFIVNDILLNLKNLKGIFVGVNKHGANAKKSLQEVDELFASEKAVFVFPAGLVSRRKRGVVEDLEWKKTFVTRARKHNKPIIPVHIDGILSDFFYRLANLRMKLGIKSNIEMLYLANEQFKLKGKTVNITIGKPVEPSVFSDPIKDKFWAEEMKSLVYALGVK